MASVASIDVVALVSRVVTCFRSKHRDWPSGGSLENLSGMQKNTFKHFWGLFPEWNLLLSARKDSTNENQSFKRDVDMQKICPCSALAHGVSLKYIAATWLPAFLTCTCSLRVSVVGFFSSSQVFMEMQGRAPLGRHEVDPLRFPGAPAVIGLAWGKCKGSYLKWCGWSISPESK